MNYQEFKQHIGKSRLTIKAFAELVKLNPVSISNLAKTGEVPSHLAIIAILLAEMAERGIDFRDLLHNAKIPAKKPRGAGKGKFGGNPTPLIIDSTQLQKSSGVSK